LEISPCIPQDDTNRRCAASTRRMRRAGSHLSRQNTPTAGLRLFSQTIKHSELQSSTRKVCLRLAVPLPKVVFTWLCSRVTVHVDFGPILRLPRLPGITTRSKCHLFASQRLGGIEEGESETALFSLFRLDLKRLWRTTRFYTSAGECVAIPNCLLDRADCGIALFNSLKGMWWTS
jgi:hypothetical protein